MKSPKLYLCKEKLAYCSWLSLFSTGSVSSMYCGSCLKLLRKWFFPPPGDLSDRKKWLGGADLRDLRKCTSGASRNDLKKWFGGAFRYLKKRASGTRLRDLRKCDGFGDRKDLKKWALPSLSGRKKCNLGALARADLSIGVSSKPKSMSSSSVGISPGSELLESWVIYF